MVPAFERSGRAPGGERGNAMSERRGAEVEMTAADDHKFQAYRAPAGGGRGRRGGLAVVQEIFGVNDHIRDVCDRFAAEGYETCAPALFDRLERGVELGYDDAGRRAGLDLMRRADMTGAVLDTQACVAALRGAGAVGVVGFCWGGRVAWVAACRAVGVAAAVCYYGGGIHEHLDLEPQCPVMLHYGRTDAAIPLDKVELVRAARPEAEIRLYDAGHGFNCDRRGSWDEAAAGAAMARTLAFLGERVGGEAAS